MNKLLVSDGKLKYLEPGIYCATVKYEYGNTLVGNTIINDGTRYGDRTDTIEVEISKGKFGRGDYLSAFIMNNRMDIYSLPESPDSLTIDEHGESITYLPSSYLVPSNGEISEGFSDMFVKLNGHFFFKYDINIFAKGGRCATSKVPTVEEVLAVNLKHEALKGEAEGRFDEEVAKIAQKNASLAAQEDAIQNDKIAMSGRSQQDIDYAFEQQGKRYNSRMRSLDDFNNRASVSRSRHSLLKNPALAAGNQTSTAKSDQSDGIWYRIKRSVSGLFSGDEIKPEVKTIEINSSFQTAIINVSKGEEITVAASGKINLGFFAGSGDPNGIDGFETYSRVYNLRHGSLIGRFGNGDWFSVGTIKTITAPIDAPLELTVNDNDSGNNQGSFKVEISTKK